tara:strand:+ start:2284 stop:3516 length:1233 start_codon:yes stop_codon:yes gene_type:complete
MRILFLVLASMLWLPQEVLSQSYSGSAYNIYGFGTMTSPSLTAFSGLGNTSIGVRSPVNVNISNPAATNAIQGYSHQFDIDGYFSVLNQSDKNGTGTAYLGGLQGMNFWFRTSALNAVTVGVKSFSRTNYSATDENKYSPDIGNYSVLYQGTGGVSQFYAGFGHELFKSLHVGVKYNFLFGNLNDTQTVFGNTYLDSTVVDISEYVRKAYLEFGAQYEWQPKWLNFGKIVLGATYKPVTNINTRISELILYDSDSLLTEDEGSMVLPKSFGYGVSFSWKRMMLAADMKLTRWNEVKDVSTIERYVDQQGYSLGFEIMPKYNSQSYFDRVDYRFGLSLSNYYLKIKGTSFMESSVNVGLGLPVKYGAGVINLGYQYHLLGTTKNNLIREVTNTISVGFSIRESWFKKPLNY